jgi:hypothetical protein
MRVPSRLAAVLVLAMLLVGACGSTAPSGSTGLESPAATPDAQATVTTASPAPSATARPTPSPTLSRDDGWRADFDHLLEAREQIHPDPWHDLPRVDYVAAIEAAKTKVPTLTDEQALVELVRLAAMPSWTGREGHTGIFPFTPDSGTHEFPILVWQFRNGMVITSARAPYEDLVGSRIVSIEGRPIDDVMALVEPLSPRDNPSNLLAYAPLYMRVSELLTGLGVQSEVGPATFGLVDPSGVESDVEIVPVPAATDVAWHGQAPLQLPSRTDTRWLRNKDTALWWDYLASSKTLYVQYNQVRGGIDDTANEILARAKQGDVAQVVVDLRNNGGGDNTTYGRLLSVLQDPAIDRPGRLTVLIGRLTFSAAANFATTLEQTTDAEFAGEAMGGSPNLYGDVRAIPLTQSGQVVFMASRYWEKSTADDERITIRPRLRIVPSSEDYFDGIDPVLVSVTGETPVG